MAQSGKVGSCKTLILERQIYRERNCFRRMFIGALLLGIAAHDGSVVARAQTKDQIEAMYSESIEDPQFQSIAKTQFDTVNVVAGCLAAAMYVEFGLVKDADPTQTLDEKTKNLLFGGMAQTTAFVGRSYNLGVIQSKVGKISEKIENDQGAREVIFANCTELMVPIMSYIITKYNIP